MKMAILVIALAIVARPGLGQSNQSASTLVKVPDAATAVKLAEKVLANIYGKKTIEAEKPFEASLSGGIWHVSGTLYCGENRSSTGVQCVGGVAMADIRQRDGRVMKTEHGK